jgi:undecaprenyl-diphosphatase
VNPWDNGISRWFASERTPALSTAADVGTLFGETVIGLTVALLAGVAFSLWQRSWRPVLFVVLAEAGIGALYFVVTHVDSRQRPPVKILDPGLVPDHSFPSGHVATAVVAYGGLFLLVAAYLAVARRWALPLLLVPVVVLLSRLYQGAHHLTDVLTSVGYAAVWLLVLARLLLPRVSTAR